MRINSVNCEFPAEAGIIEGILDLPESASAPWLSVNCHPHSLHGGSMTNKVVYSVSRSMAGLGIAGLRFNFRGVGKSSGEYDHGQGEQHDLAAAVAYMQSKFPDKKLIVSGFSFGAYVSALAAHKIQPELLLSVAPPVDRFDFADFVRPSCPWHVLMGDADELVDYEKVRQWLETFSPPPPCHTFDGSGHFFHGRLLELRDRVAAILREELALND